MAEIILVRHGETQWNRETIFRGRADVPLSERGQEQARLLAAALAGWPVAAVYTSPLSRARETAQPIAEALGLLVVVDAGLVDMSFGAWEGRSLAEVQQKWPELYDTWQKAPQHFQAPGGESLSQVLVRAWPVAEEIAASHKDGTVVIVSHRVVCKLILCAALGAGEAGFWRLRQDTAALNLLVRERERWVAARINDTHHLRPLGLGQQTDF